MHFCFARCNNKSCWGRVSVVKENQGRFNELAEGRGVEAGSLDDEGKKTEWPKLIWLKKRSK